MTTQEKFGKGKKISALELAKQSRLALRTSSVNVGVLATQPEVVGKIIDNLIPKAILDTGEIIIRFDTKTINLPHDGDGWALWGRKGTAGPISVIDEDDFGTIITRPEFLDIKAPAAVADLPDDDVTKASTNWQYQFVFYTGVNGNPDYTGWFSVEIDRNAPEQDKASGMKLPPNRVDFTNLPVGADIDDDWLEANDALRFTVYVGYEFSRPDDEIDVFIGTNYGVGTPVHTQALSSPDVAVPRDKLPPDDSMYFLWYVLRDVVGNSSANSYARQFNVKRRPQPRLIECYIPTGIDPDPVDLEDLKGRIYLNVPYTENGNPTDTIRPSISNGTLTYTLVAQQLGQPTVPPKELQFEIPVNRLLSLWGTSTAALAITAQYQFTRGVEPAKNSVPTKSALDFSYRGPENPGFPGNENIDMVKVTVTGASGTPNHIIGSDRGNDATISTPMIASGTTWTLVGDEVARLWLDGKELDDQLITDTADPLTFTIDKDAVDAITAGKKIAYWTIEGASAVNVIKSPDTEVTFDNALIELEPPTVRLYNNNVSCRYLTPTFELPVTVPIDATHMPAGTVVTLRSVGTTDDKGLDEITGTEFTDTYTIQAGDTVSFVKNIQPYLTKLKPIQPPFSSGLPNGYIKIWYEVPISGIANPSKTFFNVVSLLNDSNRYCEGTPTD